ncbi:nitroreductase family protein [Saccharopolyspora erythraea]|uniref:nitroreductase family protein n=1 Tax=Saccharopolyspora erythraea TaxID=1836 RepID=UPI001BA54FCC|nr:nitroreductase family protein [Saccharopolyspora erythraea]QUH01735.1 nitroreductase family protein [Saccharopolyspora erythraea]
MSDPLRELRSLRATRWFTDADVADEDLRRILDTARWTGSARNRQPWRFHTVRNAATREELSACGAYALHVRTAPVVVLLALDRSGADAEFDGGRVAQTVMLAAQRLGLGSCPVTFFPADNAGRVTALAGFAPPWEVRTGIALGHPAPTPSGTSAIRTGRLPLTSLWTRDVTDPGRRC